MFGQRVVALMALLAVVAGVALSHAGPTSGARGEQRYVVQPGDTLWAIALSHYDGDPREAVWRIGERNGLESPTLVPGRALVLPP